MKKISAILAILVALTVIGCGTTGGAAASSSGGGGGDPFSVDLSTLKVVPLNKQTNEIGAPIPGATVRNPSPFTQNYDDLFVLLPEFPVDVTKYTRITIRAKYFNDKGEEISQGDGNAMVSVIENVSDAKNIRGGGAEGIYPNIPLKQYNLGGFSGTVSTDKGARIRYSRAPGGILFQNSNVGVKFIEVTEIIFHD
jgi:hypothetical protein